MSAIEVLEVKLKDIDQRRAELEELLQHEKPGSYRKQELQTEAAELFALRRSDEFKIAALKAPTPPRDAQRARFIEREVAARRAHTLEFIEKLEREGDHRNARLWRRELLNLREQVEKEFGA